MAWLKTEINQLGQPSRIHNPNNYLHKDAGIILPKNLLFIIDNLYGEGNVQYNIY